MAIALSHQTVTATSLGIRSTLRGIDLELQIANCRYRYKNKIDLF